jgi:O-antigen/teichoic acid export membrane protein
VIWTANQYPPSLFVANLAGGEEVAWFGAANRVICSLLTFAGLYYFNLCPAIARATITDRDELASMLAASFRVVAWGGTFVALVLTLLAKPLSLLVFGHRFGQSAPMLMIMAWILPIALLSGHARWSLVAAGIQTRVVYAQAAGSVAITILGIPSVVVLGGRGAASASVGGCVAVRVASHAFAARHGGRLPALTIAARPAAVALAVIGVIHVLGINHWSAGLGAVLFAAAAPLLDRKLLPGLTESGAVKLSRPEGPDPSG